MDSERDDSADADPRWTGPVLLALSTVPFLVGVAGAPAWFYIRDWFGR